MDFEALKAFLAVADLGSFLAAADQLYLSRTTLRRHVEALEAQVGTTLFVRSRQGAVLTEAGEHLARGARVVLQEASGLLSSVQELGRSPRGRLRLVLPAGLPPHVLVALVATMHARWPDMGVDSRISADPAAERLDEVDVALCFDSHSTRPPWVSRPLLEVQEHLVASPSYLARRGVPQRPEDLVNHTLLAWDAPGGDPRSWTLVGGGSLRVDPSFVSSDIHLLRASAAAGVGIAFVPDALVPTLENDVVPVLEGVVGRARVLHLLVPSPLVDVPKVRRFVELIEGFLRTLPKR